ncbi:hypothetical protein TTHERM_00922970 (macronuclear) [Tetrahymena thermophila SB210]|uniref:Uncharacterized protein n=1 Tax=Tetrahymena thermophila (strain SB210) TaxID=312017 RepID=Q23WP8_TETTS|nr:hypothetical protein TTHERM_00922970 [Tetrahymena thermophila SB210]EAS00932.1 hypothetical protein TTHERM_00922970 [Tetrahymena thermophila SB210]|eukprot:XP_001021177.1 hypothetical protein TTHERM_00922970 [Tetrahymena thermophila SB210]
MDPLQQYSDNYAFSDSVKQERMREIQQTIQFYKTAPVRSLLNDIKNYSKHDHSQIELTAYKKVVLFNQLEDDEKKLLKSKLKKQVFFNLGLLGVYKVLANHQIFGINMKYFRRIVQMLTFKKGILLWPLSPLVFHYDYQEVALRLGMKYYLLEQNKDLFTNTQISKQNQVNTNSIDH